MAWELEITHVDVQGPGDATLIVARDEAAGLRRSVLVDGGLQNASTYVNAAIVRASVPVLDVVIATHYDQDHVGGLSILLTPYQEVATGADPAPVWTRTARYAQCRIFDQGQPGDLRELSEIRRAAGLKRAREDEPAEGERAGKLQRTQDGAVVGGGSVAPVSAPVPVAQAGPDPSRAPSGMTLGTDLHYGTYSAAIHPPHPVRPPRPVRVTTGVLSTTNKPFQDAASYSFVRRQWLVGMEVMWNGVGNGDVPPGAPSLRCVAANQYVQTTSGPPRLVPTLKDQDSNAQSLAFLLTFGNFRYYVGGDLTAAQETAVGPFLNPADDLTGRVHVMKASHHGSKHSSPQEFLQRIRPQVVVISCSSDNKYGHPDQEVVDRLEALAEGGNDLVERYFLTGEDTRTVINRKGRRPKDPSKIKPKTATKIGDRGVVAGVWPEQAAEPLAPGDVTVRLTAEESTANPVRFHVHCTVPVVLTDGATWTSLVGCTPRTDDFGGRP